MDADVVVIGGGLAGRAVACFLARAGVGVALVDAGSPGVSATGVGRVDLGVVEHPHRTVASLGESEAKALFDFARSGRDVLGEEGLLSREGGLWVALDPRETAEIPRSVEAVARAGHRAEAWSADQVAERIGCSVGPALFLPGDGSVDPAAVMAALRASGRAAGVVEVRGEARFDWSADSIRVDVAGEAITAELAVIAAGAGSVDLDPALAGALLPVREQHLCARVDRSVGGGRAGQGWTAWRTDDDGSVVVSGCRWASPHLEVGQAEQGLHPAIQQRLEAFLTDRLGVTPSVISRWSAGFAQSRDGLPLVGPLPGDPRRIVCAGFGASPWALSMAAAQAISRNILGEPTAVPTCLASRRLVRWRRG